MNVTLPSCCLCCFTRILVSFAGKSPSQYYWNFINLNQRKEGKRGDPEMQRRLHEYHLIIFIKLHFAYFVWARDKRSENIDTGNYFYRKENKYTTCTQAPNSQQFKVAILKIVFCILLQNLALNAFYCLCRLSKDYARENRNGTIAFGRVT